MRIEWRPENWGNPYFDEDAGGIKRPDEGYDAYEEGADAMLEALREQYPCFIDEKQVASIHFPLGKAKGYLVFIPEDEDVKEC